MKALELEPPKAKLQVVLVEKEYEEPWDIDQFSPQEESLFGKPSGKFCEALEGLVEEYSPDFVTDELGMRSKEQFRKGKLAELFESKNVRFEPVEMDDYAKPYLAHRVKGIRDGLDELMDEYNRLYTENPNEETRERLDRMLSYGQRLQQKYEEECDEISYPVRQKWLAMGILDIAREYDGEDITALHLCSPSHMAGMQELLESLEVKVVPVEMETRIEEPTGEFGVGDISEYVDSLEVQVVPKIRKREVEREDILLFFDTDPRASPFDICMASDAGFDVVVPYQNLTADSVKELVQDAIFSRGTKGVKHTSFFLGGSDLEEVREMLEVAKDAMFGPFQASIVVDPQGANTTGSALVAKVEEGLARIGNNGLRGKKVAVIAGTGPVGRVVATLCANEGADVTITSRREEKAKKVAEEISSECGHEIGGRQASNDDEIHEAVKDADVILSTAAAGIRTVSKDVLERLSGKVRIVADANAVPPTGIEGLDPNHDMEEFIDGIYGIGALVAGNLKNKVEMDLLVQAREAEGGVFDHWKAYESAKEMILPAVAASERKRTKATIPG